MTPLVSPYPPGFALDPDQGGTGNNLDGAVANQVLVTDGAGKLVLTATASLPVNTGKIKYVTNAAAELGAQINAALNALAGPGVVVVACNSGILSTAVNLGTRQILVFAAGAFVISAPITLTNVGAGVTGAGWNSTALSSTCAGHTVIVNNLVSGILLRDFKISRTGVAAIAGQDGIHFNGISDEPIVENIWIENCWNGLAVQSTGWGIIRNCFLSANYNNGFDAVDDGVFGTLQWQVTGCISQSNNGYGYYTHVSGVLASTTLGEWRDCATFGNGLGGMWFVDSAGHILQSARISGGFGGQDGDDTIRLDIRGNAINKISDFYTESAGTIGTGRTGVIAASNIGSGIRLSANIVNCEIDGCEAVGHSSDGIAIYGGRVTIGGASAAVSNGVAAIAGHKNGVYVDAGTATIVGNDCSFNGGYGVFLHTDGHIVDGNNLQSNVTAGLGSTDTLISSRISANINAADNSTLNRTQITAPVVVNATTVGTANTIVTAASITCDGVTPITVRFYAPYAQSSATIGDAIKISLYDGAASIAILATVSPNGASVGFTPVMLEYQFTPAAGAHVFSIRAFVVVAPGAIGAGNGGNAAGSYAPAFLQITR